MLKFANFSYPHMYLAPSMGVAPSEFHGDLWH